ncbi:MAG: transglycosylase SLT domain-containing protein [Cellvibrionaceae bacterium]
MNYRYCSFLTKTTPSTLLLSLILVSIASVFFANNSYATIYRYIDPNGRLVLTDTPKHAGYIPLVKTQRGWVPQYRYSLDPKNRRVFSPYIRKAADRHRLPYHLLHAVITVESAYNAHAVSHAGAQGLMQLMPATAERFGVTDPFNPRQNINGGSRYLSYLIELFNGDFHLALAAYNAGENAVKRYGNRIPPYKETQNYVRKVMKYYKKYRFQG